MQIPIFQVDAFTDKLFGGNPAAVCPLESWLPEELMQSIAAENNLADTAFFTLGEDGYEIRWFTPTTEIALCGHATLASAAVLFERLNYRGETIVFNSQSGSLKVTQCEQGLELNFPAQPPCTVSPPPNLEQALGVRPIEVLAATDLIAVLESSTAVAELQPDLEFISQLPYRGLIVTAQASDSNDFVCRFFAPQSGIDEDPVTGSAYTELAPYWAEQLDKPNLQARQLSARGGYVHCQLQRDRVLIRGQVKHYLQGIINIEGDCT